MYEPIFELKSLGKMSLVDGKHLIEVYCEALIATNRTWLKRNPGAPKFYELAPKYALKLRPFGINEWQDYPQTIALGEGDCKDFVCMRVAELREAGCPDCGPRILAQEAKGIISYHVRVDRHAHRGSKRGHGDAEEPECFAARERLSPILPT